jgi:multidrug resistance efflux pump
MTAAILVIIAACANFWLVFFKLKLPRLTPGWAIVFSFVVLHLFLVFLIGLRFVTPNSANATVVQRTIQLIPRLPEPILVTTVLVEDNVQVKKDQPLFQFDRRPYEYKVKQIEAQLAEARQNVHVLEADVEVATQKALRTKVDLDYQLYQKSMFDKLAQQQAVREEDVVQYETKVNTAEATRNCGGA